MRQIYNMNESIGEAVNEGVGPVQGLGSAHSTGAIQGLGPSHGTGPAQDTPPPSELLQCLTACAHQTRLSLANLLPSRFVQLPCACSLSFCHSRFSVASMILLMYENNTLTMPKTEKIYETSLIRSVRPAP